MSHSIFYLNPRFILEYVLHIGSCKKDKFLFYMVKMLVCTHSFFPCAIVRYYLRRDECLCQQILTVMYNGITCRMGSEYKGRYAAAVLDRGHQNCCAQHPSWQTLGGG